MGACSSKSSAPFEGVVEHEYTLPLKEAHPSTSKQGYSSDESSGDQRTAATHTSSPTRTPAASKEKQKRTLRGYSSGGSSEYSDEVGCSAHGHLEDWRKELASNGEVCAGVVRIEVCL